MRKQAKNVGDAAHQYGIFKAALRQKNRLKCSIRFLLGNHQLKNSNGGVIF